MNSGLIGSLGTAPLQTVKARLNNSQGRSFLSFDKFRRVFHTASPNNLVNALQIEAIGGTPNVDLVLTPKGTGAFILGLPPDNTTTGGSKRGAYSTHLSYGFGEAGEVAGGDFSFTANYRSQASGFGTACFGNDSRAGGYTAGCGGQQCTADGSWALAWGYQIHASGANAVAFGRNGYASGQGSAIIGEIVNAGAAFSQAMGNSTSVAAGADGGFARGIGALSNRYGMRAESCGGFAVQGDAQLVAFIARNKTTTNTAVELFLNGSSTRLTIPSGKIFSGTVNIVGSKSDGTAVARYLRQVTIKNVAGTTSLVGSVIALGTDEASGTSVDITANDTNDSLIINVTGVLSETWRWMATIEGAEMAYGT